MRKLLLLTALVFSAVVAGWAQGITTSSITGQIKDEGGGPLPGANVIAVHEPSGTEYGITTNEDGRFTIPNMRVGGPYKITITFVGNETQTYGGVFLKLGEPFNLQSQMKSGGTELAEVVISDVQDKLMNSQITGTVTNVSSRQIMALPTITRSLNDMTRLTPQATTTSQGAIAGGNYRQNYITVDGSAFNNTFGIGGNLPANGSPISLDAIEEISVSLTPYDIRQSNFIGSSINAVTRSGTNQFSGSAYTFWRNENQQGDKVGTNDPLIRQPLQINTYGFRLGGPIMKNKLFFFVNYERGKEVRPGQLQRAATATEPFGSSPEISRPTAAELDMISQYLDENFGYKTGAYDNYDNESDNTRIVGRLDWNINKNHRINIRYSQVESKSPSFLSSSTTGSGISYGTGAGRTNNNALWFKNTNYYQEANFYSLALEANSLFGKFANTFRATYTNQNDPRSTESSNFPFVDILDGVGAQGVPFTSFGYEPFSYGNLRDVQAYSFVDYVAATFGKHNVTAGVQVDIENTRNGFQRFGRGYYVFNSWNAFISGANPINYAITYSLLPGYEQAFPKVGFSQYSVYAQDEYSVSDKLKITAGLRLDLPTFPSVPEIKTHPLVAALSFEDGQKFDTGVMPETRVMFSPRIGFNYDVTGDRSIQVRGGTGIFTGRVPTVWIVSQSGDAGLLQFTQSFTGAANTPGPFNPDPDFYLPATQPAPGTQIPSAISAIDPDFKFPQTWKSSLAVDASLPGGIVATLEGIYNKDLNIAVGKNLNLVDPTPLNIVDGAGVPNYADTRPIYPVNNRDKFLNPLTSATFNAVTNPNPSTAVPNGDTRGSQAFNATMLSNGNEGYYWSVTAKLDKQFDNGLFASIAYVRSQSKVLYDGIGDQLLNTWSLTPISQNANSPGMSYAGYVVPDRFIASLSYRKEWLKYFATQISLVYEGSIQGRFSYTYSADFNRDGQTNDLIYIPKDPTEIDFVDFDYDPTAGVKIYTAAQQEEIFFRYIEQDKYLNSRKGQYAERNGAKMPWRNQIDVRFAQDIFMNIGPRKNTLQFTLDIFNFGNLLNPNWGTFDVVNAQSLLVPTNVNSLVAGGTVRPTFRLQSDRGVPVSTTYRDNNSITSTYYMQFGLRYIFN